MKEVITLLKFIYKNNPKKYKNKYKYKNGNYNKDDNKYIKPLKHRS